MDEAAGSIPASSTPWPIDERKSSPHQLAGLIAGEGSFLVDSLPVRADGTTRLRFRFAMQMADRDADIVERLRTTVGGSIGRRPARKDHWLPTVSHSVNGRLGIRTRLIPFLDQYLIAGAKRRQYLEWRQRFAAYEERFPSNWGAGPSPCAEPDCDKPVRGRGCAVPTTTERRATDLADFLGGFTAAEGCFHDRTSGAFAFTVALGADDLEMVELFHEFFACGRVTWRKRRKEHYDDEVTFVVRRMADLVRAVIPFMDEHLPPSYKRQQYEVWRAEVLAFWDTGMKRRRQCTVAGCEVPQRAKGLCRSHYYARYGK